jgi:hypothetical protein
MKLFAFSPKYYNAPDEIISALVPNGLVTEAAWRSALESRIYNMVTKEPYPEIASKWACMALGCPIEDNPGNLFDVIFYANNLLRINLNFSNNSDLSDFEEYVFQSDLQIEEMIEACTIEDWVEIVANFVGGESLDCFEKHKGTLFDLYINEINKIGFDESLSRHYEYWKLRNYEKLDFYCEFDNECDCLTEFNVLSKTFDFYFSVQAKYDWIQISCIFLSDRKNILNNYRDLQRRTTSFNSNHATKLTPMITEERSLFHNKRLQLNGYKLELCHPDSSAMESIYQTFLLDILNFFECGEFNPLIPESQIYKVGFFSKYLKGELIKFNNF